MPSTLKTYLELCRFPAVFTAAADVFLGLALTGRFTFTADNAKSLAIGVAASAGLYLGGMVLNDLLDRRRDAEERPSRPIPSGRVSPRAAWAFYAALTVGGLLAAACGGAVCLGVAAAVAGSVWLYDGPLKRTPLGPAAMGACRVGNVLLGASVELLTWDVLWKPYVWAAAVAMGVYVTGLTLFARTEAVRSARWRLLAGVAVVNGGIVGVAAWSVEYGRMDAVQLLGLVVIAYVLNRRLVAAVREPAPEVVGPCVKRMLLMLPILDAVLVAAAGGPDAIPWAVGCALLVLPAATAGRVLRLT